MNRLIVISVLAILAAACEPIDTSALQDIQDTVAQTQATAETINARTAQVQAAVENPVGALTGLVGASFTRTPTDQPGVFVLTDLQTGCQFLATYAADGRTVSSIAPRTEAGGRQRCIAVPGVRGNEAQDAGGEG